MEEIVRFLLEHPPFSQLPLLQIQRIASAVQIEYFGQGVQILTQGGKARRVSLPHPARQR
jgi:hypothetical protein